MAMTLEEMLRAIGCSVVWHASGVTDALAMMRSTARTAPWLISTWQGSWRT